MAQLQVRDITGSGIPLLNIRFAHKGQSSDEAFFDIFTDLAGNSNWPLPFKDAPAHDDWSFWVNVANVNHSYIGGEYFPENQTDDQGNVVIHLGYAPLTRLHVENHDFYNEHGQRVFIKGATDFLLYQKFLAGEDITPLLAQRSKMGVNCVRVIGMVSSFSHWYPQEHADYYDRLFEFSALVASYGMYIYFTIFADTGIVMPNGNEQLAHYHKVVAALAPAKNILFELVNEPYAHSNATHNPWAFPKPEGVIYFGGSYNDRLGDTLRPVPPEDAHDFHTPRDAKDYEPDGGFKWAADQVMTAHPEYKRRHKPVMSGEPQKFADPGDPRRGNSTLSNPALARKMAGSARGAACGIFYHTASGVFSTLWNDTELRCAEAWFKELA